MPPPPPPVHSKVSTSNSFFSYTTQFLLWNCVWIGMEFRWGLCCLSWWGVGCSCPWWQVSSNVLSNSSAHKSLFHHNGKGVLFFFLGGNWILSDFPISAECAVQVWQYPLEDLSNKFSLFRVLGIYAIGCSLNCWCFKVHRLSWANPEFSPFERTSGRKNCHFWLCESTPLLPLDTVPVIPEIACQVPSCTMQE